VIRLAMLLLLLPALARADDRWDRYQLLMWQDRTPAQMRGLREMGFTGAKLNASGGRIDPAAQAARLEAGLAIYLENIATDFYAAYHRFFPDRPVNAAFVDAQARHRAGDPTAFDRAPSLSDPAWLDRVRERLARVVRETAAARPLFYNLADEAGIADLAAAWDFDRSAPSLGAFRAWLPGQYGSIEALNRQWGTAYADWAQVVPETTDQAIARTDGNFSAWSDFRSFMDVAFARAVRAGTEAVHAADPTALAALEGGQVPGWGGYDYRLLAPAVDVFEIYDVGNALDLATAFNPAMIPLRTSFGQGRGEVHAIWRSVLHGARGTIVWDEADTVVQADGAPGPRGRELSALARAIDAAPLRGARPDPDGVAVLVNQVSFQLRWLLDRQAGDRAWTLRDAEREYDDNAWRASRRVVLQRLSELGVQPRIVAEASLPGLAGTGVRVLILPHAIALSAAELDGIAAFRAAGGTVLADTEPGLFDGHGRRRAVAPLPDVAMPAALRNDAEPTTPTILAGLDTALRAAGVVPRVTLHDAAGTVATGVEVRWFRTAAGPLMALQRISPGDAPVTLTARLAAGTAPRTVVLDPIAPSFVPLTSR
jgi:hypothetical protein